MATAAHIKVLLLGLAASMLIGCASKPDRPTVVVPSGDYALAFDAARDVLRRQQFTLNRVDAADGVITTRAKPSAGLATPWNTDQSTVKQEWQEMLNRAQRTVRVSFVPLAADGAPTREAVDDLRAHSGPVEVEVQVTVSRVYRPGWNVDTTSVRRSGYYWDRTQAEAGMYPSHVTPLYGDRALSSRLVAGIEQRIEQLRAAQAEASAGG